MTATTLNDIVISTGVEILDHLDRSVRVPVLTTPQVQGDVFIRPAKVSSTTPVPPAGVPIVRGENGGNTHSLHAEGGPVFCDTREATVTDLVLAFVVVPEGSVAHLLHPEHGAMSIGAGSYEIRRQRQQAEMMQMVAD